LKNWLFKNATLLHALAIFKSFVEMGTPVNGGSVVTLQLPKIKTFVPSFKSAHSIYEISKRKADAITLNGNY
jgi:hypothetical protein